MPDRRFFMLLLVLLTAACNDEASEIIKPDPNPSIPLTTELVISGLDRPVLVTAPRQQPGLWVVTRPGVIHVWDNDSLSTFLDLRDRVKPPEFRGFHGMASMAFHPDYADNGWVFVVYTHVDETLRLSRFQVTGSIADPTSETVFLSWQRDHPTTIHDGCHLAFDPLTGYLFMTLGDGTDGSPNGSHVARELNSLAGKLLRIDVDQPDAGAGTAYSIPPDNPFVGVAEARPEIWSLGLRNPWRFSIDALTGDLYIGDVGNRDWEEINWLPAGVGGQDFGWNLLEGNHCTPWQPSGCSPDSLAEAHNLTAPLLAYDHNIQQGNGCPASVIGGVVYRGTAIADLQGHYFYADFCNEGAVWRLQHSSGTLLHHADLTEQLDIPPGVNIASFGEDGFGEIYLVGWWAGRIFKVVPQEPESL